MQSQTFNGNQPDQPDICRQYPRLAPAGPQLSLCLRRPIGRPAPPSLCCRSPVSAAAAPGFRFYHSLPARHFLTCLLACCDWAGASSFPCDAAAAAPKIAEGREGSLSPSGSRHNLPNIQEVTPRSCAELAEVHVNSNAGKEGTLFALCLPLRYLMKNHRGGKGRLEAVLWLWCLLRSCQSKQFHIISCMNGWFLIYFALHNRGFNVCHKSFVAHAYMR